MEDERSPHLQENGATSFIQSMLTGKYTYLTYFLMSTTCFFFWITPNCYKLRSMFSFKSQNAISFQNEPKKSSLSKKPRSTSQTKAQMITRSLAKQGKRKARE